MGNDIEVTAYEDDKLRYQRLERVVGYICAIAEHYGNEKLLSKIKKLHDQKGILEVHWLKEPTEGEKEWLVKAWLSSIGDGADNVEHLGL